MDADREAAPDLGHERVPCPDRLHGATQNAS
jgi:hypothetical protein